MVAEWNRLPEQLQLALAREALHRAATMIAAQAEVLAEEIENGGLADHGGPEALRLFAAVVRVEEGEELTHTGHA